MVKKLQLECIPIRWMKTKFQSLSSFGILLEDSSSIHYINIALLDVMLKFFLQHKNGAINIKFLLKKKGNLLLLGRFFCKT